MAYLVEVTDTFGGEANYCWVKRYKIEGSRLARLSLIREAKRVAGWSGIRCSTWSWNDGFRLNPRHMAQVMFITYIENEEEESAKDDEPQS